MPKKLILPALRGTMGNWVFYSCLMDMKELAKRVEYADKIHQNEALSKMIQRRLKGGRSTEIARYLERQKERFFNSLVIATYGGEPNWHALTNVNSKDDDDLADLTEEQILSVGFLTLQGDEKLFAVDGQHRLSGIKKIFDEKDDEQAIHDEVSVIFVAHKDDSEGLERTRRLFTTLNKTARPVSKADIIALDEDDTMAICTRWLVENSDLFAKEGRILIVAGENIPSTNQICLTTIINLYELLTTLFTKAEKTDIKKSKAKLQQTRLSDKELQKYFELAEHFFNLLRKNIPELSDFFAAKNTQIVVEKHRGKHGGSVVFRPIGLSIFTQIITHLTKKMELEEAISLAAKLPRNLDVEPYRGLMWDSSNQIIIGTHKALARKILLYMLGYSENKKDTEDELVKRYKKATGDETKVLPERIV